MKKIIKGIIIPVLLSIIIGFIFGKYIFSSYKNNLYRTLTSSKLYLIANGEYDTIDNMRVANTDNSYIYYKDNNKYKTIIGITHDYDNIDKIKNLYNDNISVYTYYIANDKFNSEQLQYDSLLSSTDDSSKIKEVVNNILNLYRDNLDIKLISG